MSLYEFQIYVIDTKVTNQRIIPNDKRPGQREILFIYMLLCIFARKRPEFGKPIIVCAEGTERITYI